MDYAARCEVLERELAEARERIAFLEAELGADEPVPLSFRLTGKEARLFGALMRRPVMTKEMGMAALYSGKCDADGEIEPKIIDVFVCKIRAKLKPFGIAVETMWGSGWRMSLEHKALVQAMMDGERGVGSSLSLPATGQVTVPPPLERRPASASAGKP